MHGFGPSELKADERQPERIFSLPNEPRIVAASVIKSRGFRQVRPNGLSVLGWCSSLVADYREGFGGAWLLAKPRDNRRVS